MIKPELTGKNDVCIISPVFEDVDQGMAEPADCLFELVGTLVSTSTANLNKGLERRQCDCSDEKVAREACLHSLRTSEFKKEMVLYYSTKLC